MEVAGLDQLLRLYHDVEGALADESPLHRHQIAPDADGTRC
jgi:hypothetical protein